MDCTNCKHKVCIKKCKPCSKVNKLFRRLGIYGDNYIRPGFTNNSNDEFKFREIPFTSMSKEWNNRSGYYNI